jgi:hypothetical protein
MLFHLMTDCRSIFVYDFTEITHINTGVIQEAVLGDKGYQGEAQLITSFSCPVPIGKIRQPVEHAFARVKKFSYLKQVWRHSLDKHCMAFHVCCEAVNCETR